MAIEEDFLDVIGSMFLCHFHILLLSNSRRISNMMTRLHYGDIWNLDTDILQFTICLFLKSK